MRQMPPKMETRGWQIHGNRWVRCAARMKAASDSPDQSSNAPLIAQEVWRPAVTLSPSLISYQTQSSNKCAIFPPTELQGRRWLTRMWSLLYWCGEFLWSEQRWHLVIDCRGRWVSGYQFRLRSRALGKPYFLCRIKGQLQSMMWQGQMVLEACMCMLHDVLDRHGKHQLHIHTLKLYLYWAYRERRQSRI